MGCASSVYATEVLESQSKPTLKRDKSSAKSLESKLIASRQDIRKVYNLELQLIGKGTYGKVRMGRRPADPEKKYAVKTISKDRIKNHSNFIDRELESLRSVDHPNIVKFYEIYEDNKYYHIVMEHCSGGDLLDLLYKHHHLNETFARRIMHKIFGAVNYLHTNKICHRDIKPDNFLFTSHKPDAEIKLIDFGLSRQFGEVSGKSMRSKVGTPQYVAPEIFNGRYDEKCDMWSLGVLLFVVLSGYVPFEGESDVELMKNIRHGVFFFDDMVWDNISNDAKDLITKLLVVNPKRRISAAEAMEHPWFTNPREQNVLVLNPKLLLNMISYQDTPRIRSEAMKLMVNLLTEKEMKGVRDVFQKIDKDHLGHVTRSQFEQALGESGLVEACEVVASVMKALKIEEGGVISYTKFLCAAFDPGMLGEDKLWAIFKYWDTNNEGAITVDGLKEALLREGRKLTDEEVKQMIEEVDGNQDGKLDIDDLRKAFKNDVLLEAASQLAKKT
eukprot:TRINITY_DN13157_c0_g1_i1.p1 TRINITY_DN13157_c0_g1~~TRINITY_DN13157_c0_g1_i1.p1  ORF type:complete len:501 (+),score=92.62 TRINITY_DN13157_c0_g1_i1:154-1656(+)